MAADGDRASKRELVIAAVVRWWSRRSRWVRVAVGAAVAALVVFVAVALVKWVPELLAHQDLRGKDAAEDQ